VISDASRVEEPRLLVDVVIVNYNGGAALGAAVRSVRASRARRVVIVDNASRDRSIDQLVGSDPDVDVVRCPVNRGYGAGANAGITRCDAPYVLIMNPDVEVAGATISVLASVLDKESDVAAVGPRIVDSTGATYPSARRFPSLGVGAAHALLSVFWPRNRWSLRYRNEEQGSGDTVSRESDWVSGACMLVRKVAFDSIGGFDEGYFMYVEDLDLCWRLRRAGWRIRYEPLATSTHLQGLSTSAAPYRMLLAHHVSTWRFAVKSMTGSKRPLLVLVGGGLVLRAVVSLAKQAVDEVSQRRR
jgi:N-acetylglucosaminyl-diphospho-decaprenol L-rhamnosyltransferase